MIELKAGNDDPNNKDFKIKKLEKKIKSIEDILLAREKQTEKIVSRSAIKTSWFIQVYIQSILLVFALIYHNFGFSSFLFGIWDTVLFIGEGWEPIWELDQFIEFSSLFLHITIILPQLDDASVSKLQQRFCLSYHKASHSVLLHLQHKSSLP